MLATAEYKPGAAICGRMRADGYARSTATYIKHLWASKLLETGIPATCQIVLARTMLRGVGGRTGRRRRVRFGVAAVARGRRSLGSVRDLGRHGVLSQRPKPKLCETRVFWL